MSGTWTGVRRLAPQVLVAMLLLGVASTLFVNFVLFRAPLLVTVVNATHGLVGGTMIAILIELPFFVVVVVVWGGARWPELGLQGASVPRAVLATLAVWSALNGMTLIYDLVSGTPVQLASHWDHPSQEVGAMLGQLFGNALYEEVVYRGVLVSQLARWIERGATPIRRRGVGIAVAGSQLIFMLGHVPNRLALHLWSSPLDAVGDLARLWVMGIVFAVIWLRTRNLLVAVGVHALSNVSGHVFAAPGWLIDAVMIAAFLVLMIGRPVPRSGLANYGVL